MSNDKLELQVGRIQNKTTSIIRIKGEIDFYTVPQLKIVFDGELKTGVKDFLINLNQTTMIDSTGLGTLIGMLKKIRGHSGEFKIVCNNAQLARIFEITRLIKIFSIHETEDEALGITQDQLATSPS